MQDRKPPVAFLSYVNEDDDTEGGRISKLMQRLSREIKFQTGEDFPIFQDRKDIKWGDHWNDKIVTSIEEVAFLIPIITPSYFNSKYCREELQLFILKQQKLKKKDLILPLYYAKTPQISDENLREKDELAKALNAYEFRDITHLRFVPIDDPKMSEFIAKMAEDVIVIKNRLVHDLQAQDYTSGHVEQVGQPINQMRPVIPPPAQTPKTFSPPQYNPPVEKPKQAEEYKEPPRVAKVSAMPVQPSSSGKKPKSMLFVSIGAGAIALVGLIIFLVSRPSATIKPVPAPPVTNINTDSIQKAARMVAKKQRAFDSLTFAKSQQHNDSTQKSPLVTKQETFFSNVATGTYSGKNFFMGKWVSQDGSITLILTYDQNGSKPGLLFYKGTLNGDNVTGNDKTGGKNVQIDAGHTLIGNCKYSSNDENNHIMISFYRNADKQTFQLFKLKDDVNSLSVQAGQSNPATILPGQDVGTMANNDPIPAKDIVGKWKYEGDGATVILTIASLDFNNKVFGGTFGGGSIHGVVTNSKGKVTLNFNQGGVNFNLLYDPNTKLICGDLKIPVKKGISSCFTKQ